MIIICSIVIYIIAFLLLSHFYGQAEAISSVIPVITIGWLYGLRWGIISALLSFLVNNVMYAIVGISLTEKMTMDGGGFIGTFALILFGAVVGRISDLSIQLKEQRDKIEKEFVERKRVEEKARESSKHLENIFKTSADGILITGNNGVINLANEAIEKILGYSKGELAGKSAEDLTPKGEKHIEEGKKFITELRKGGVVTNFNRTWLKKDGSLVDIEISAALLKDKRGTITGAVASIRDITERKQDEEQLRETKEYLDNIINSSLDAIIVADSTGNITRANESFLQLIGYQLGEIKGMHVMELSITEEGQYESTTGEIVTIGEKFFEEAREMTYEKLFKEGKISNWETYYIGKNMKVVPIEQNIVYLYDEKGEMIGSLGVIRDITKRKKAEKEIREATDFLENIFKTAADGILVTDNKGVISVINEATSRMLGYSKEEIVGKGANIFEPEGEEYDIVSSEYVAKLLKEGTVTGFEFVWLKKDGKLIDIEVNAALLKDSKGNITGAVTSIRDITDRKQQEEKLKQAYDEMEVRVDERTAELKESNEQLQQEISVREEMEKEFIEAKEVAETANRAKSEFLANMSHEFRTPLNHIIGFTELVVDKKFGEVNETQEDYLGDVLQSSKHLLLLVNDILDLSKVEAGKLELKASSIDPRILIDNSLIMFKEKSFKHGIKLSSDVDHVPETIIADERKLKQILYNLLSNAVKFTPDGGKVGLSAMVVDCIVRPGLRSGDPKDLQIIAGEDVRGEVNGKKHGKCVQFSVSDTGIGIKAEDQSRIFSPFEQVDGSTSRRYQGTGLGLPLTKKLVEIHGGKIWMKSEGDGKGSTFNFIIPI
jgi:PAS domain S-box-containing protein